MEFDERRIAAIVAEVIDNIRKDRPASRADQGSGGIFTTVDAAIGAAAENQRRLAEMPLAKREQLVQAIRRLGVEQAEYLARKAHEATGLGRVEDKIIKNKNASRLSPGTEDLITSARTDDHGMLAEDYAPFGVIVSVTPATHPTAMILNHAIIFVAGGNTAFIAPHPRAQAATLAAVKMINEAVNQAGGPSCVLTAVAEGTMETVDAAMRHPLIKLVTAAGGPGVVRAALGSGKKAIVAGPGNPPVVIDETADAVKAAKHVADGAFFDNNILCIAEKEVFVVNSAADAFLSALSREKCQVLTSGQAAAVSNLVVKEGHVNPDYIGKNADHILKAAGIQPAAGVRGVIIDVSGDHPLVGIEQLMPVLPVVRVNDFKTAVDCAVKAEHGYGHTAIIHSRDMERIHYYGRFMSTTILVSNAPSYASLGVDGPGVFGHTIASPATGEGVCTPKSFCRRRIHLNASGRFI
ncbi:MAG: aldehyde dehydrogenase [Bacillota bacterium]